MSQLILNIFVSFLSSISGAFFGAVAADRFSRRSKYTSLKESNVRSLQKTFVVLTVQYNNILITKKEIDPYRSDPFRFLSLPASSASFMDNSYVDINDILFLSKKDPNLIIDINITQDKYKTCLFALKNRTDLHLHKLQPVIEQLGINGEKLSPDQLKALLGDYLYDDGLLRVNNLYESVDDAFTYYQEKIVKLYNIAKQEFPEEEFICPDVKQTIYSETQTN